MTHPEVYKRFKAIFPEFVNKNIVWYPNGRGSIRIRHTVDGIRLGKDLVFSCDKNDVWRLETVDSFIKDMKGGNQNA